MIVAGAKTGLDGAIELSRTAKPVLAFVARVKWDSDFEEGTHGIATHRAGRKN
jgi:hypothetical protein